MKYLILVLMLTGCGLQPMTTEEIVYKLDECKKYNLHPDVYRMFGDGGIIEIQCAPNKEK